MKIGLYIIIIIFFSYNIFKVDLNCQKFKEGVFYIPFNERIGKSYHIFRLRNNQVEIDNDKNETYISVKWIDECSYVAYLKPESAKLKRQIDSSLILDSTVVIFQEIIGDTVFYKSTSFFGEKKFNIDGKMIRLGDVPPRD